MSKKNIVQEGKALIKSKTFWFNLLSLAVLVANYFGFGSFQPDPRIAELVGFVAAIGNVYLRTKTNTSITSLK